MKFFTLMLLLPPRNAMWIADIVHSRQLATGQVFSGEAVQHFKLQLKSVAAALTNEAGAAMMLILILPRYSRTQSDA